MTKHNDYVILCAAPSSFHTTTARTSNVTIPASRELHEDCVSAVVLDGCDTAKKQNLFGSL